MNKQMAPKRWIVSFFAIVLSVLAVLSGLAYIIDPFFQFRVKDNSYMLKGSYVGSGLIKNYDYDTLIIGSSMTQNFDMDLFREKLGAQPLHIGIGGMNPLEISELMHLAYESDMADQYYICVDISYFGANDGTSSNPQYLLKNDLLSKIRYLLSYETWFGYIPVDIAFMVLDKFGVSLPPKYEYSRSIDKLEDCSLDYAYGEEIVIDNYVNSRYSVSDVNLENLYERMTTGIDDYLSGFDYGKGEHVFFFPPYSSLFWCNAQDRGYFDIYLRVKQHFIEKAMEHGAIVYDFQSAEFTMDLDNYRDTTHYAPEINDWMVECFADYKYVISEQNKGTFQDKLVENTEKFRETYAELFFSVQ